MHAKAYAVLSFIKNWVVDPLNNWVTRRLKEEDETNAELRDQWHRHFSSQEMSSSESKIDPMEDAPKKKSTEEQVDEIAYGFFENFKEVAGWENQPLRCNFEIEVDNVEILPQNPHIAGTMITGRFVVLHDTLSHDAHKKFMVGVVIEKGTPLYHVAHELPCLRYIEQAIFRKLSAYRLELLDLRMKMQLELVNTLQPNGGSNDSI
jgi:hypothetical protein